MNQSEGKKKQAQTKAYETNETVNETVKPTTTMEQRA